MLMRWKCQSIKVLKESCQSNLIKKFMSANIWAKLQRDPKRKINFLDNAVLEWNKVERAPKYNIIISCIIDSQCELQIERPKIISSEC